MSTTSKRRRFFAELVELLEGQRLYWLTMMAMFSGRCMRCKGQYLLFEMVLVSPEDSDGHSKEFFKSYSARSIAEVISKVAYSPTTPDSGSLPLRLVLVSPCHL